MHIWNWIRRATLFLATTGLLVPTQCLAQAPVDEPPQRLAPPPSHSVRPLDVALDEGNILRGFVVDSAGQAVPSANVVLMRQQQLVAVGQADIGGRFAIANVQGGIYQVAAGDRVTLLRCWVPNTAPPSAKSSTLIQVTDVERAQISPASCSLMNPWVIAGVAIAAIVIPIAINANRDDRDTGS